MTKYTELLINEFAGSSFQKIIFPIKDNRSKPCYSLIKFLLCWKETRKKRRKLLFPFTVFTLKLDVRLFLEEKDASKKSKLEMKRRKIKNLKEVKRRKEKHKAIEIS